MKITIPISVGELLDKITILQIKSQYSNNSFIHKELSELINIAKLNSVYHENELSELLLVNQKLWKIEDEIREYENQKDFSENFIQLARQVYLTNDERAEIKKRINQKTNSEYREIKLHKYSHKSEKI
jgi:hypothetical protein